MCAVTWGPEAWTELKGLGADAFVDAKSSGEGVAQDVRDACDGVGPQSAIVLAPGAQSYRDALAALVPYGVCVAVSLPADRVSVDIIDLILHGKRLVGSIVGSRLDLIETIRLAAAGVVTSHVVVRPLADINKILADLAAQKITGRVVVSF